MYGREVGERAALASVNETARGVLIPAKKPAKKSARR
jgi:hypothetical protein